MIRRTYPYRIFDWLILLFSVYIFSLCIGSVFYLKFNINSWKLFDIYIPNFTLSSLTLLHFINKKSEHFYKSFLIPFSFVTFVFIQQWFSTFYVFGRSLAEKQRMIEGLIFLSIFVVINLTGFFKNKADYPKVIFQYVIFHNIFNVISFIPYLLPSDYKSLESTQEIIMRIGFDFLFIVGYIVVSYAAIKEKIFSYKAFSLLILLLLLKRLLSHLIVEYFSIYLW